MADNGLVTEAGGDPAAGYETRETLELVELMNEADSTVPAAVADRRAGRSQRWSTPSRSDFAPAGVSCTSARDRPG